MKFLKKLLPIFGLLIVTFKFAESNTTVIIYDDLFKCEDFCTGDECFDFFDLSALKILPDEEDETVAYVNGSWKMNVPIKGPVPGTIWAERMYGTKWITEAFNRRYKDACTDFFSPLDPVYEYFKDKKRCPYAAGDEIIFEMKTIALPLVIPPSFVGEWRMNLAIEMTYEGKFRKQCRFFRFDVYGK